MTETAVPYVIDGHTLYEPYPYKCRECDVSMERTLEARNCRTLGVEYTATFACPGGCDRMLLVTVIKRETA